VYSKNDILAVVTSAGVVALFVMTGLFGRVELRLLLSKCRHVGRSLLRRRDPVQDELSEEVLHLEGSRDWETLWESLSAAKRQPRLSEIRLNISWPVMHEEFHAMWRRPCRGDLNRRWRMDFPLLVAKRSLLGSVSVLGELDGAPTRTEFESVLDLLGEFESQLEEFVGNGHAAEPVMESPRRPPKRRRRAVAALAQGHPR